MRRLSRFGWMALVVWLLAPAAAFAQASIAGVVKDASGAVLPGVTVEAASPALIEKTRSVVTDGTGQYKIVDLAPGTYSVTFSLQGFNSLKRDGIELAGSFNATVNVEMRVGAIAETITVTAETPIVDVQNATRERILSHEVMDAVPANPIPYAMAALIPGVMTTSVNGSTAGVGSAYQDVGGAFGGSGSNTMIVHGSKPDSLRVTFLGIGIGTLQAGTNAGHVANNQAYQEVTVDTSAQDAVLATGGVRINLIPRDGGNQFHGVIFGSFANSGMQGSNYTDALKAAGLLSVDSIKNTWDINPGFGGPIKKDKVWFYATARDQYAATYAGGILANLNAGNPNSWTYAPDPNSHPFNVGQTKDAQVRLTWQVNPKHKIAGTWDEMYECTCPSGINATTAPEAAIPWARFRPKWAASANWSSPLTSRLLIEVIGFKQVERVARPGASATQFQGVTEQSTGLTYRAITAPGAGNPWNENWAYRAGVSYVTGAHAFKVGINGISGQQITGLYNVDSPVSFRFNNGVPNQITLQLTPYTIRTNMDVDMGLFAQDRWTIDRLTLGLGVRFDYMKTSYPVQHVGPVPLSPLLNLTIPETTGITGWKDVTPKLNATYDLFGDGKTAVRGTLNKYVAGQALSNGVFGASLNPISRLVVTTTRSWTDSNRNFIPDCNLTVPTANGECGVDANTAFGSQVLNTTYDPVTLGGWGSRGYNWEFSTGVQRQVLPRVSVDVGYFRRWFGNFVITDNTLTAASDYATFSVTAPVDSRLPGGGGNVSSGFYDVNPNKAGQVQNLVAFASNYGKQTEHWNGFDFTTTARLPYEINVQGGVSTGRTSTDNCEVVAQVPELLFGLNSGNTWTSRNFCQQDTPFLTSVKVLATSTIPKIDIRLSATMQSLPGPMIQANFVAVNAAVQSSLGRALSGGAANTTVGIVQPSTLYGERLNQLDLRIGKLVKVVNTRTAVNFDIYNVLNSNTVLVQSDAFATWQRPQSVLTARFVKLSVQFDF